MGRGDLKITEVNMLLQRMALAAHVLVSVPRGLKPTHGCLVLGVQGKCIDEAKGEGSISSQRCPVRAPFDLRKKP